jgi:hypothetical protein
MERDTKRHRNPDDDLDNTLADLAGFSPEASITKLARLNVPGLHQMLPTLLARDHPMGASDGPSPGDAQYGWCAPFWAVCHRNLPLLKALTPYVCSIKDERAVGARLLEWPVETMPSAVELLQDKFGLKVSVGLMRTLATTIAPLKAKTALISCCWRDKNKWVDDPLAELAILPDEPLFVWGLQFFDNPTSRLMAIRSIGDRIPRFAAIVEAAADSELPAYAEVAARLGHQGHWSALAEYVRRADGLKVLTHNLTNAYSGAPGWLIPRLQKMPAWTPEVDAEVRAALEAGGWPQRTSCIAAIVRSCENRAQVEYCLASLGATYWLGERPYDADGYVRAHLSATLSRVLAAAAHLASRDTPYPGCERDLFSDVPSDLPLEAPFSKMEDAVAKFCKTWQQANMPDMARFLRAQLVLALRAAVASANTKAWVRERDCRDAGIK